MMVYWSGKARRHLAAIRDYIAQSSPRHARGVIARIIRRAEQLEAFPESGAVVDEFGDENVRELVEYSYRIIYRLHADRIEILAVIHGAQQLPTSLPG